MSSVPLLSDPEEIGDSVSVSIRRCGRYTPNESIWKRQSLWSGRLVTLLNDYARPLKDKIKKESSFSNTLNECAFPKGISLAAGAMSLIVGCSFTFTTCFYSDPDNTPCIVGKSALGAGPLLLSIFPTLYARHRYQVAHGKCPSWKEKERILKIFQERLGECKIGECKGSECKCAELLSGDTLRDLLMESELPRSLKEKIAVEVSLNQYFKMAKGLLKNEVEEELYPLMHSDDQAILQFLLYPSEREEKELLNGLSQLRQFFVRHPSILFHIMDQVPTLFEAASGKEYLQSIADLNVRHGVGSNEFSRKIELLLSDSVTVRVGNETVTVSRRKLCQYERFAFYFAEEKQNSAIDGDDNGAARVSETVQGSGWKMSTVTKGDQGEAILDFPLLPDQNEARIVSILQFIENGRLPDEIEDPIALMKEADYYGVKPLVDACMKCLLDAIASSGSQLTKEQKADQFEGVIHVFPYGFLPENVIQALAKEYHSAADSLRKIQEVHFWLKFAERVSPDQLFHQLIYIPNYFSTEFVDLICQMKPKALLERLNKKLLEDCRSSRNPVGILEAYGNNKNVCALLADTILDLPDKKHIVPVWDFACRRENSELKRKVARRLKRDPSLEAHWPFLSVPKELLRMKLSIQG